MCIYKCLCVYAYMNVFICCCVLCDMSTCCVDSVNCACVCVCVSVSVCACCGVYVLWCVCSLVCYGVRVF